MDVGRLIGVILALAVLVVILTVFFGVAYLVLRMFWLLAFGPRRPPPPPSPPDDWDDEEYISRHHH